MSKQSKEGVPYAVKFVVGAALMVGGFWFSKNVHLAFQDALAEQGLPLDLGMTVSVIGTFVVLFPLMKMFYFDPLSEAISARTRELEQTFSEAESLRNEMSQMRAEYEHRLTETEASAREQIQAQIREAQSLREQLRAEAVAQAEELKRKAREDIEQEKHKVMAELRGEVINLTLHATERLVGEAVDNERNRKLVKEFIDKVEVPR